MRKFRMFFKITYHAGMFLYNSFDVNIPEGKILSSEFINELEQKIKREYTAPGLEVILSQTLNQMNNPPSLLESMLPEYSKENILDVIILTWSKFEK